MYNFVKLQWPLSLGNFLILLLFLEMAICVFGHYTNQWALEIDGGEEQAKLIADKHNLEYIGKIFDNVYHFSHRRLAERSTRPSTHHHVLLKKEPSVRWAEQQVVKRRVKRDFQSPYKSPTHGDPKGRRTSPDHDSAYIPLSDPKWEMMWYLNRGGGLDMNVQRAWRSNVTGKGIVVTILDDGLEKDHPDLIQNYDPNASYDVNGRDPDPMPRYDLLDSNRHGTRCAGEVAAKVNNSICSVGVAYEALVGGVRMLDGDVTDAVEARSLSHNTQHIDIYSASWGPDDDGKTVDGPGQLATRAFVDGVATGRNGKGSIFVWASGNGGRDKDNCNCDGYTNSIWTLSISSATERGGVPWYSEACSSTLATTYSSGSVGERQIITTDLHHGCTTSHTGTSASAPLAAGICALALQANPKLTWRDMQHVVVRTARPDNLNAPDWQTNGVGRKVSHRFGYGLMDAYGMVQLARNWTSVPQQRRCEVPSPHVNKVIPQKSSVTLTLEVSDCPGVNYLEHVQAKVTLSADRRGDIQIFLISPSGTKSNLLAIRHRDNSRNGFHSWPFMTVHMWGESPFGIWKLEIHNNGIFFPNSNAQIQNWTLFFYGTEAAPGGDTHSSGDVNYDMKGSLTPLSGNGIGANSLTPGYPQSDNKGKTRGGYNGSRQPPQGVSSGASGSSSTLNPGKVANGCLVLQKTTGLCLDCVSPLLLHEGQCIKSCPFKFYVGKSSSLPSKWTCLPCHYSCRSCTGPFDYECSSCWQDALLFTPSKDENYCRSKSLLENYYYQQTLLKLAVPLFIFLFCFVMCLAFVVFRNPRKDAAYLSFDDRGAIKLKAPVKLSAATSNGRTSSYSPVPVHDKDKLMINRTFHDNSSDDE